MDSALKTFYDQMCDHNTSNPETKYFEIPSEVKKLW